MQRGSKEMFPFANPWSAWWSLGIKAFEMSVAAAEVVTHRSVRMAGMSIPPGPADRRELGGMVSEKVAASQQSAFAMLTSAGMALWRIWWQPWLTPWSAVGLSQATARVLSAGVQPYRKRAISNAKRLRRRPAGS